VYVAVYVVSGAVLVQGDFYEEPWPLTNGPPENIENLKSISEVVVEAIGATKRLAQRVHIICTSVHIIILHMYHVLYIYNVI